MNAVLTMGVAAAVVAGLGIGWVMGAPHDAKPPSAADIRDERAHQAAGMAREADAAQASARNGAVVAQAGQELVASFHRAVHHSGEPAGADPDTVDDGHNTMKMFGTQLTIATPRSGPLSAPTYLPDWAPPYPGAALTAKVVQRKDGQVIGRSTDYETNDDFDKIVNFYDSFYASKGMPPKRVFVSRNGKTYHFDDQGAHQEAVILKGHPGGRDVAISIVQVAAR